MQRRPFANGAFSQELESELQAVGDDALFLADQGEHAVRLATRIRRGSHQLFDDPEGEQLLGLLAACLPELELLRLAHELIPPADERSVAPSSLTGHGDRC